MLSKTTKLKIVAITDNKSAIDSRNSTYLVSDKRLRVEMAALREYQTKCQVNYQHVKGAHHISDVLTKRGAFNKLLLSVLQQGALPQC